MLVVHPIAAVFVTIQAAEDLIIAGTDMTIAALIPLSSMSAVEDGKDRIMLDELGRFPGIETVAFLTLLAETGLSVIRNSDGIIVFLMAGITFGLQRRIFPFDIRIVTGTAINPGMDSQQREGSIGMGQRMVNYSPGTGGMTGPAPGS